MTNTAENEAILYQTLQERYRMCQQRSQAVNPFGRVGGLSYSRGLLLDPLEFDLDFR